MSEERQCERCKGPLKPRAKKHALYCSHHCRTLKDSPPKNWRVLFQPKGKAQGRHVRDRLTEAEARALAAGLNAKLIAEQGVPRSAPFDFYFCDLMTRK